MFSFEDIQRFNDTETGIYRYVIAHTESVAYMTIRELAAATFVSPSTILRWCDKLGYPGYTEFRNALREENERRTVPRLEPRQDLHDLALFFDRANSPAFEEHLDSAVRLIGDAEPIVFIGEGSSGVIAEYGARLFANLGIFAVGMTDAFYPVSAYARDHMAVIAVSESGETPKLVKAVEAFRAAGSVTLGVTNSVHSTLERLCDWSFSAGLPSQRVNGGYNATTQVPALFAIESLGRRLR
ncbi:MurR/RpiR family transcriptional regulator [Bifidobacterium callimiconis]|uniref:MurR/RpiR family transcriptional regulator n=1 Tax=Bifidobacterium callimiconis TaxID=2306973 RepID=UPI001BDBF3D9|nr:MurR/RpiR family transcriptional regulator [Bifidobacterium callimiconis]MBT1177910.1 MurR/RpiR family transcriptional regulator [Bifidobacterium callimiconis]